MVHLREPRIRRALRRLIASCKSSRCPKLEVKLSVAARMLEGCPDRLYAGPCDTKQHIYGLLTANGSTATFSTPPHSPLPASQFCVFSRIGISVCTVPMCMTCGCTKFRVRRCQEAVMYIYTGRRQHLQFQSRITLASSMRLFVEMCNTATTAV